MIEDRIEATDWKHVSADLDERGHAVIGGLLDPADCEAVAALYSDDTRFRSRVVMARHGYGRGEYKYFAYPLPDLIGRMRTALYPQLAPIANRWHAALRSRHASNAGGNAAFPEQHADFLARCHAAGQTRPTPLILKYETGDFNCLHQDLYGEHVFLLQAAILLSAPGRDFTGGEFLLTEQRPRRQSRADVVGIGQGDAVVFAVHQRPVGGTRGIYRVHHRHGVSRLESGRRHMLGLIFHDAK